MIEFHSTNDASIVVCWGIMSTVQSRGGFREIGRGFRFSIFFFLPKPNENRSELPGGGSKGFKGVPRVTLLHKYKQIISYMH